MESRVSTWRTFRSEHLQYKSPQWSILTVDSYGLTTRASTSHQCTEPHLPLDPVRPSQRPLLPHVFGPAGPAWLPQQHMRRHGHEPSHPPGRLRGASPRRDLGPLNGPRGFLRIAQGVAGLGHSSVARPSQLASYFGSIPGSPRARGGAGKGGVVFFGGGPYILLPGIDVSRQLTYTPLTVTPGGGEYLINLKGVIVNNKLIPLNTTLFSLSKRGLIGAVISTTSPYTALEHSIYSVFANFFAKELSGVPQVKAMAPFGTCFDSKRITNTRVGPAVPLVDLVPVNKSAKWRIFGANSMVEARPGVTCLAFVDGGVWARAQVVIGSHQLEENFVQFDLAESRLGFSSSLLFKRTSCANFNFGSSS
ncbi:Aspartic peptidase [Parasponia andersonii]|uniref:Aspartic peptidase n=1 Tax=Parasponia andersonii TaxID=3476 RepID=A0A2P5CTS2_PARAD|nr:Aspartic peptidase [Parasponia andersonii]